jgi:AcrR family transcriptional regulator
MPKIREETRVAVLEAAWNLMAGERRLDAGMAEIAAAAGVTRQTVFLAFGNRAGVLVAMARHQDTVGDQVPRMREIAATGADVAALHAFVDAWLDYLPVVYPVAIQLEAASLSDADADAAWQDRIFSQGVRMGLDRILGRIVAAGGLGTEPDASRLADLCLTLLVPSAWRYLVVERGWTADAFAHSRHVLIDALLASTSPGKPRPATRKVRR